MELINTEKHVDFLPYKVIEENANDLTYLFSKYFHDFVMFSAKNTRIAKKKDIESFLKFYYQTFKNFNKDLWTPSISKLYQNYLSNELNFKPTTVNRKIATLRHAASWIEEQYKFEAGHPLKSVSDIQMTFIRWKGLHNTELMRLRAAIDIRLATCKRLHQNPLLEATIFYILLNTGLRVSELCKLNYGQYDGKAFNLVKRKGNKVSEQIPIPTQAREYLNQYLSTRGNLINSEPLLVNGKNKRLRRDDVGYFCERIRDQANSKLPETEHSRFSPHSLRHTFLKKVTDKFDIHVAQELSGNVSVKEIYRYTRPSFEESAEMVEKIFD